MKKENPTIKCACGCGEEFKLYSKWGKKRKYVSGHNRRLNKKQSIIKCDCGCGEELELYDIEGRKRRYINGHNNRKYDDPNQHKREWNKRNKKKRYETKNNRLFRIKSELITKKGGCCLECKIKYNGVNSNIFDFHHVNPEEKLFNIMQGLNCKRLEDVYKEIKKCILLCSNCHRIKHHKFIFDGKIYKEVHIIRENLILEAGDCCSKCKIKRNEYNSSIFDFHHTTPENKKFQLSKSGIAYKSIKDINLEFKKCILLCSNCHRIIKHSEIQQKSK